MKSAHNTFDIIVIGAGAGGLNIASFMNAAGLRVLLIDKTEESIGGDCLNFGCVPSKALIHVARLVRESQELQRFGYEVRGETNMQAVRDYVASKKDIIREHENKAYFEKKGMTVVIGHALFASRTSVVVEGYEYHGTRIVIATGSRPRMVTIPGADAIPVYTNESIFDVTSLPKNLLVIGGGPIGIELGQALAHLGSSVHVVMRENRVLPREDKSVAELLQTRMEHEGIVFHPESTVTRIEGNMAHVQTGDATARVPVDGMLVAVGREPVLDLDLEKAGIAHTARGITVNEYLETTNSRVVVCGDAVGQHQFTHAAEVHAGVILRNLFVPRFLPFLKKKLVTRHMAWVTYTSPEIATFGLCEADLKKSNTAYRVLETDFKDDDRAIVDEVEGVVKLFVSPKGEILGGTMAAPNAGELIQELILAQTHRLNVSHLFAKVYPYPTATRVNKRLVSIFFKEKLTPRVKKLMRLVYR